VAGNINNLVHMIASGTGTAIVAYVWDWYAITQGSN